MRGYQCSKSKTRDCTRYFIFYPVFLILSILGRQVRRAFRNIRRTLPEIGSVLILFALILGLFSFLFVLSYSFTERHISTLFDLVD